MRQLAPIAAALHARGERPVELREPGLLRRERLLLRLLGVDPVAPPVEQALGGTNTGADCSALAGIATDGAADHPEQRAARRAAHDLALLGGRGCGLSRGLGWIDPGRLLRPGLALALILALLLGLCPWLG